MNIILSIMLEIFLWTLTIYFTIYCLQQYIDGKNILYASCLHLLLILLTICVYPVTNN